VIAHRNEARFEKDREIWEASNPISRLRISPNYPGRKPTFKHTEDTSAYVLKDRKGGINWFRYQEEVLLPLLFLFAKEYQRDRPNTLVMEDGASPHAVKHVQEMYSA